jgi:hypothetical protein
MEDGYALKFVNTLESFPTRGRTLKLTQVNRPSVQRSSMHIGFDCLEESA